MREKQILGPYEPPSLGHLSVNTLKNVLKYGSFLSYQVLVNVNAFHECSHHEFMNMSQKIQILNFVCPVCLSYLSEPPRVV